MDDLHLYYRPRSVTWWVGVSSFLLGVLEALSEVVFHWQVVVDVLARMSGGLPPAVFIGFGLSVIGIRKALATMGAK